MAGTLIVSNLTTDTDNTFIVRSNTGTTLFSANTTGIDVANSIGATAITNDKILSVANTKISGNIISSQITSIGGSQITANTIANSAIQTGAVENYMNAQSLNLGMRNRIINGSMIIDQRNAGGSVTPVSGSNTYPTDRWTINVSQNSKITAQQNQGSVTPPAGFSKYLGVTVGASSYSIGASDYFVLSHWIEGYNVADLNFGTANARTVTLSFQVYSSLIGTYGGVLQNYASNRSYPFTYTISSANTWTTISIVITGDTSGTWEKTNSGGMGVIFGLGVGSTYSTTAGAWAAGNYSSVTGATSLVGTANATWYITGIQLEKGSSSTPFEYRDYATEMRLCQRYFYKSYSATGGGTTTPLTPMGMAYSTTNVFLPIIFPVPMRGTPTFDRSGCRLYNPYQGNMGNLTGSSAINDASNQSANVIGIVASGLTIAYSYWISASTVASDYLSYSAEL
jgi:hypothetical protein